MNNNNNPLEIKGENFLAGGTSVYGINTLYVEAERRKILLQAQFYNRSWTKCKAAKAAISYGAEVRFKNSTYYTMEETYGWVKKKHIIGRDSFSVMTVTNRNIGSKWFVSQRETLLIDFYNYLMINSHLPLLQEWTEAIMNRLQDRDIVKRCGKCYDEITQDTYTFLHDYNTGEDKAVRMSDVIVMDMRNFNEDALSQAVTELIQNKVIKVADVPSNPLDFENFDEYIKKYGPSLVRNLEGTLEPLSPLKGELDGFAAKNKRLYPQQAACVNGIIALKKANSRYGLMVEGMGCGKTLQGAAVIDAYFNQIWLGNNKGKTLKDLYMSKKQPKYRNVLMAPSHLVAKWKEEIESEIPGAKAFIVKNLEQLVELRSEGKERKGRHWYLFSKDFAKLGYQKSPIPTTVGTMIPKGLICADCYEEDSSQPVFIKGYGKDARCEKCGGRHFKTYEMVDYGMTQGLVCPSCGNLLIRSSAKYMDASLQGDRITLMPEDFTSMKSENEVCFCCGEQLWGIDCKTNQEEQKPRKWVKISYWKNYQRKNRDTSWMLRRVRPLSKDEENTLEMLSSVDSLSLTAEQIEVLHHLNERKKLSCKEVVDLLIKMDVPTDGWDVSPVQYGPRRYSPSQFIKKYLNGYFDFCVLDECHKYEGAGSAQAVAAHSLMSCADFTLGLTGTITNGRADSLFYLLYMLDPTRMNKLGYSYSDVLKFSETYGAIETIYELSDSSRNKMSRGRRLAQPKVKPGISPKLFTDFLLDKAVFLDLSDLSKYLPPLKEQVVIVGNEESDYDSVLSAYNSTIATLKNKAKEKGGFSLLSTMLQFGLSYPDKPYGNMNILHPKFSDVIAAKVENFDQYENLDNLLPKEQKLVEIVQDEVEQNRNCFIYCAYTGAEEKNVTDRLMKIVEKYCNLKDQVYVLKASSPKAEAREEFIHKKASEGIRVFICNMKLVETGLDFCFKYKGTTYNYPSIIFYQLTYELSVMWQASRRHYRLNQHEECHTYYLAQENTLQTAAVQVMAEKQIAASAIQGKFSADGLASMA